MGQINNVPTKMVVMPLNPCYGKWSIQWPHYTIVNVNPSGHHAILLPLLAPNVAPQALGEEITFCANVKGQSLDRKNTVIPAIFSGNNI